MVVRLLIGFIILPFFIFAGEFTATVNRNQVHLGEHFTLHLILKEESAHGAPSLEPLKTEFHISSQQQSSNVVYRNGKGTSSVTWKVSLSPKREGQLTIPSVSISTNHGIFSTSPIKIDVLPKDVESNEEQNIHVVTHVNKKSPYKNEPLHYFIKILAKTQIENLNLQKLAIDNAIVEQNGDPKIKEGILDGVKTYSIEFKYLITPLKEGVLTIPSLLVQGGILTKNRGQKSSFFDDDFEPFFSMSRFGKLKPFTLTTEEIAIDVRSPIAGVTPWLPASAFKIEEIWDHTQKLQVGEPITRGFIITAEGLMASQLPNLNDIHTKTPYFNAYADKAETGERTQDETIHSYRKENYTLIPLQAGQFVLPEISIGWWDTNSNQQRYATVPSRVIQILPAQINETNHTENSLHNSITEDREAIRDPLLFMAIGGLGLLLCGAIIWGISLQRKIKLMREKPTIPQKTREPKAPSSLPKKEAPQPAKNKHEKLPDLNPT